MKREIAIGLILLELVGTPVLMACTNRRIDMTLQRNIMQVELILPETELQNARELLVTAKLTNKSTQPIQLNTLFLPIAPVVFQVYDSVGNAISLAPPPVPPLDDGVSARQELAPGESLSFRYSGNSLFGTTLPPGVYSIQFHFNAINNGSSQDWEGLLQSESEHFTILPPGTRN
ncbi:MAG TPA: hypothetical protein V6D33_01335 [Cyanophyceae cyanobacterium]